MGFGDFDSICRKVALPVCTLVGPTSSLTGEPGILAQCYSRTINVANTLIYEGATGIAHISALVMTVIMIIHVRSKFTAVGRKEITTFFYLYFLLTVCSLILDCGVAPPGTEAYRYFVAIQNGLSSATAICLMINGFVGFQLYEDGTTLSVWLLRGCTVIMFVITFLISLATFKSWGSLNPTNTVGLFVVLYILTAIFIFVYLVMQILLVLGTLQDRWPLGHIAFGVFFFVMGQILLYVLNPDLCNSAKHYVDATLLATVCNLLAVMMVYKFWDFITKEDLEFSVGTKANNWDLKQKLLDEEDEKRHTMYMHQNESEYGSSVFHQPPRRTSIHGSSGF
ncbi:chitin synthase export chaperone [Delphinella strobiligena]|nr:chitin synthase export chaperone [Delphinella strobiligena]